MIGEGTRSSMLSSMPRIARQMGMGHLGWKGGGTAVATTRMTTKTMMLSNYINITNCIICLFNCNSCCEAEAMQWYANHWIMTWYTLIRCVTMWGGWPEWTIRHKPPCKPRGLAIGQNMVETVILIPWTTLEPVGQKRLRNVCWHTFVCPKKQEYNTRWNPSSTIFGQLGDLLLRDSISWEDSAPTLQHPES